MTSSARRIDRFSVAATLGLVLMVAATAGYIGWPRVANAIGLKPARTASRVRLRAASGRAGHLVRLVTEDAHHLRARELCGV